MVFFGSIENNPGALRKKGCKCLKMLIYPDSKSVYSIKMLHHNESRPTVYTFF